MKHNFRVMVIGCCGNTGSFVVLVLESSLCIKYSCRTCVCCDGLPVLWLVYSERLSPRTKEIQAPELVSTLVVSLSASLSVHMITRTEAQMYTCMYTVHALYLTYSSILHVRSSRVIRVRVRRDIVHVTLTYPAP
jgi:hypothetical protein